MTLTSLAMLFLQDAAPDAGASTNTTVKWIAGSLSVILLVIAFLRHKSKAAKKEEDEF